MEILAIHSPFDHTRQTPYNQHMHTTYLLILIFSTFAFAFLGVWLVYFIAKKRGLARLPEARDNHDAPTPSGAGLGVMLAVLPFLAVANAPGTLLLGIALLTIVCFVDDIKEVAVKHRLGAQAIAVILALSTIEGALLGEFLPIWLERFFLFFAWMWLINMHNFMDGIDELSATHCFSIAAGLVLFTWSSDLPRFIHNDAIILASAMGAFYLWNRHPARIFLGDAGSVPLGLIIGYLLFNMAAYGYMQAALILPAYYVLDATLTLVKRALAGKKIWQAHSEHAYQQSVRNGRNHHETCLYIIALNMVLILLAVTTTLSSVVGWICVLVAYGLAYMLILFFHRPIVESITATSSDAKAGWNASAE